jgi:hypothetical protein
MAKRGTKSKASDTHAPSRAALAVALGVSRTTVHRWIKDARWPFGQRGPYPIGPVREWRKTYRKPVVDPSDVPGPDPQQAATAQKIQMGLQAANIRRVIAAEEYAKEKTRMAQLTRLEREGSIVRVDQLDSAWNTISGILRRAGTLLQRQYGVGARDILDEALDAADRAMTNLGGEK